MMQNHRPNWLEVNAHACEHSEQFDFHYGGPMGGAKCAEALAHNELQ